MIIMKNKIIIMVSILLISPPSMFSETTVSEMTNYLMCTCGCSMPLYACECGTADKMKAKIQSMIDQGKNKDQILEAYVNLFGESILSAPTKEGFNLVAWILPFLTIGVVGVVLYKALKRWGVNRTADYEKIPDELLKDYGSKLKKELAKFEEGEQS